MKTITAQSILSAAEKQVKGQTELSSAIRASFVAKDFLTVIAAFKLSLEKHGIRSKANGNVSTATDSIRSTIDTVSASLVGTEGYAFEGALGVKLIDGEYTLYDKGPKAATKAPRVNWGRMAAKYTTESQKRAALASFAKALGLTS